MSYHWGVPPEHYRKFTTISPHSSGENVHYAAAYDYGTPVKGHRRQASYQPSPRPAGGYYAPAGSPPPGEYVPYTPVREAYVSYESQRTSSASKPTSKSHTRTTRKPSGPVFVRYDDDQYVRIVDREPARPTKPKHSKKPSADSYFYFGQEQIREETPRRTRTRRSSTTTNSTPSKSRQPQYSAPDATEEDAIRAGIPAGYSIKNWDPSERPIVLLGSVFDANSFGKWMYDWTVYSKGARAPLCDMAGDLWLLLIKLAGKMKRAERVVARIKDKEQREMVYEFIESGDRLWARFKELLKECEYYMMKAAKKQGSKLMMGKNAGTEFVDSIFGRERYLEYTEKIINGLRVWMMRFDVNCEEIIRRPSVRLD